MSQLLDSAAQLDAQRAADLVANDEARKAWEIADRAYVEGQKARDERRLAEVMELERGYFARIGWCL